MNVNFFRDRIFSIALVNYGTAGSSAPGTFSYLRRLLVVFLLLVAASTPARLLDAQTDTFNYEESEVPRFELPELLVAGDETKVDTAGKWIEVRRPEIMSLFREHVYGHSLPADIEVTFEERECDHAALNGLAVRKQISIVCTRNDRTHEFALLIYLPAARDAEPRAVPVFVGLNFSGNHTVHSDPEILLPVSWVQNRDNRGVTGNRANENSRGRSASRWPVEAVLERGYGIATIYCGDIDPDFDDGFRNGIHSLFDQDELDSETTSTIAAWSWGLSRAMDYFETDDAVDHEKIALTGHSRLGKTSLWAGASDERFAIVISNNSGCGGAALSRRGFGETVKRINEVFPHWFCKKYGDYDDNENACPVDQHMLFAAMAPRPVYIASASNDRWADPRGEYLSGFHAAPAYQLFGLTGLPSESMPDADTSVGDSVGYHLRTGGHDIKIFDWECFMDFADRHFEK